MDEPSAKKTKFDVLLPESEFEAAHPGLLAVLVECPVGGDAKWQCTGQTLELQCSVTDKIADVKQRIADATGMPAGKQKLARGDIVLNNQKSLAFYNIGPGAAVQLSKK